MVYSGYELLGERSNFILFFFTCRNTAPSSQGLAMATYTWKMNHEVVRPLRFPHHSCQRGSPSEHEQSKLINLPKPSPLQMPTSKFNSSQNWCVQKPLHRPLSSHALFYSPHFLCAFWRDIISLFCLCRFYNKESPDP